MSKNLNTKEKHQECQYIARRYFCIVDVGFKDQNAGTLALVSFLSKAGKHFGKKHSFFDFRLAIAYPVTTKRN